MFLGLYGRGAQGSTLRLGGDLRQPEVQNLRLTSVRHEDVRWLDVPVNDSLGVCCIQCICNLDAEIKHRLDLKGFARAHVPESLALQQFHRDKGSPIRLVDLVNRANVRVVQRGRSLGFPLESAKSLCVVGKMIGEELEGDAPTQFHVFSFVHNTHAATAHFLDDAIVRDGLSDHWAQILGLEGCQVNEGKEAGYWLCLASELSFCNWP